MHVLSPINNGLFRRAISGSEGPTSMGTLTVKPQDTAKALGAAVGCDTSDTTAMVECMRSKDVNELYSASRSRDVSAPPDSLYKFVPTVDSVFAPKTPRELLQEGNFERRDYMLGIVSSEGSVLGTSTLNSIHTHADCEAAAADKLRIYEENAAQVTQAVVSEYCSDGHGNHGTSHAERAARFYGDWRFAVPPILDAETYSRLHSGTYFYYFAPRPSFSTRPSYIQAAHGDEKYFLFGPEVNGKTVTSEELEISTRMMVYFSNFMKTGDPNRPDTLPVTWPAYDELGRQYLQLGGMSASSVTSDLYPRQRFFWSQVIPALTTHGSHSHRAAATEKPAAEPPTNDSHGTEVSSGGVDELLQQIQATQYALVGVVVALVVVVSALVCLVGRRLSNSKKLVTKSDKEPMSYHNGSIDTSL
ncbi:PREDICTED: acetylcholinesterase-like [Branchiostoma belcheri]|uniref:Acetylcholinesterase-like n=1 Tax=Branchiostoma belcheri TaxID=7741 RepID=A0A6P4XEZ5_BRABE|nr:PREDICTED: acetylcholinesterase-like [Branchiostoma belcheri]